MPRRRSYRAGVPCWIDCLSTDPAAAEGFYARLFGWRFDESAGYRLIRLGGEIIGGLGILDANRGGPDAFWTTYLASKDLSVTAAAVRALGGRIVMPPTPAGDDGTVCLALDTSGAAVGFFCGAHTDGVVLVDEPGALVGHQLHTPCLTTASAFYGGLVDGTIEAGRGGATLVIDGRVRADLVQLSAGSAPFGRPSSAAPGSSGRPRWIPIFGVSDLAAAASRATDGGGHPIPGPDTSTDAVLFSDPCGAVFGLTEVSRAA